MSNQSINPSQYKAGQRQEWDSVAAGWRKWWETIERGAQRVSDRLVEMAEIQPGQQVLDVATGVGEPAITAARRTGPHGRVVGTDLSPQMLAIARSRANALGLRNVEWHETDAEELAFPENTFHAALCRWGLMFFPDVAEALGRVRRLLKADGRFAASVWSEPPKVPMISMPMAVARRMLQLPPPPPGPGVFSLAAPGAVERAFTQAGFSDVRSERVSTVAEFPSTDAYVGFLREIAPPIRALLAEHPTQRQAEVWQAIAEAARQHAQSDGSVRMANEAILVVGRR